MRRLVRATALLSAAIWLAGLSGPATAQAPSAPPAAPAELANKLIEIAYIEPTNAEHRPLYERLKQRQVLEQLRQFLAPLQLPRKLKVQLRGCRGSVNAWYSNYEVTLCYEYVSWIEDLAPKENTPEVTREDAIDRPSLSQGRASQCADRRRFLRRPRHRRAALLQYAVHRLWRRPEHVQRLRAEPDLAEVPRRRVRARIPAGAICVPQADRTVHRSGTDEEGPVHGRVEGG